MSVSGVGSLDAQTQMYLAVKQGEINNNHRNATLNEAEAKAAEVPHPGQVDTHA